MTPSHANSTSLRSCLFTALMSGALLAGCDSAQKNEVTMLKDSNAQLTIERDDARNALDQSEAERRRLDQTVASLQGKTNEQAPLATNTNNSGTGDTKLDLPTGVTAENRNGTLVLTIEGDVIFDSGKASLKSDAKKTLDTVVGQIQQKFPKNQLRLVGFTDSDPIVKSGFKTNYHLGFERAYSVGQYLSSKGVSNKKIEYATWGAENGKSTKKESRRVEIAVVNNDTGSTD